MSFVQETPFDPTWVNISLVPVNDLATQLRYATKIAAYQIHELPEEQVKTLDQTGEPCTTTKKIYNPVNIDLTNTPPAG